LKSLKKSGLRKSVLMAAVTLALLFSMAACVGRESGPADQSSGSVRQAPASYKMIPFLSSYDQYRYDGEINVLYLVCTTLAEYFVNSYAVWEPRLKAQGINMDLLGPPTYSDESLISTMESALQSGKYDIIVLYPITPQAITPFLDIAWDTYKTPILAYAFAPETGCGHYYLGTSYYEAGVSLGKAIIEYVNDNDAYYNTLKTIPVAIYRNSAGAEQYARIRGAWNTLETDGRFSLIQEYEANGEAACLAATETVLTTYPDVEVILTQIDNDVTGTYQAVTSGTYKCSEYLSIWGFDATGVVCAQMYQDGIDGYVQGSALIDHIQASDALSEIIPILVGAAKQNVKIEFTQTEFDELGTLLKNYYTTVTPKNVRDYYIP
jgi:ABC-type sugar transport system substrate-binding protein